jgi:hypothetical protein
MQKINAKCKNFKLYSMRIRDPSSWLEKSWKNNMKGGTKGNFFKILPKYFGPPIICKNDVPILWIRFFFA